MSQDAIGAAFAVVVGLLVGILHLMAARNPERNALTRAMSHYYVHAWSLFGRVPSRQAMLVVGVVALLCAFAASAGLVRALLR